MPGEADDYLYVAISQTQFVFAKVMKGVSPYDAANFLDDLRRNAPAGVSSVITSDHEAFGHPAGAHGSRSFPIGSIRSSTPAAQAISAAL